MPSVSPWRIGVLVASLSALAAGAHAQARWTVDPKSSLAWWQMNPHMDHLWATTCPGEPSWRSGGGRSTTWFMNRWRGAPTVFDTVNVPLYPRPAARDVCAEAVRGEVVAPDTLTWRGVRGEVAVKADLLFSGHDQRDTYTRESVLEAQRYPEIRFAIDSIVGVTRQGDTLSGSAVGIFSLHGVDRPMAAAVRIWSESGGLRVLGKFTIPARAMVEEYGLSSHALGLGVGVRIWRDLFMGVDLLMRPQVSTDS